jgi:C4-dicarboxylate-specific signal transduction histidine kinase
MNAQALISTIAHEIRQPLAAIGANASATSRFLARTPPDYDEAGALLNRIKSDVHRASEVFDNIRTLFGKVDKKRQPVDVNEIILAVLASSHEELQNHSVSTQIELAPKLPLVDGHKGQLQEVVLNLVHNAVEAMNNTTARNGLLWVNPAMRGHDEIVVSVKDTGPGIDPERLSAIFGAFVTTKAHGTGLGLALCQMIIEDHGGKILASSDGGDGALFQFHLPIISG